MEPAIGANGVAREYSDRYAARRDSGQGWRMKVGRIDLAAARFECGRQCAGRSRTDLAALRRRRACANSAGTAAGRRRRSRAARHGHHARRFSHERRALRLRGAGSDSHAHGRRRHRLRSGGARRGPRSGVHDAHAGSGRARPFRRRPDRRASGTAARGSGHFARAADGTGAGRPATITTSSA